jgi:starch-binding outer membrane protein, SusD/RagB family
MQYRNKFKILMIGSLLLLVISCKKDFLNKQPLDTLSTDNSLATTNELRLFLNQFYVGSFPGQPGGVGGAGIAFNDVGTDNMTFSSVSNRMNGTLALSNAAALGGYTTIRSINYFLENYHHAIGDAGLINNYLGEAKFFRAITYFNMVRNYGDLTWVNKVLPSDTLLMQVPRDPRTLIIDSVLSDLDQAASLLPVRANSATMRLHRDVALALKSRVALYEASWQKYHKAKNDPFYTQGITDAKIQDYFEQARDAALTVISSGRWSIYNTGKPLEDYFNLFVTLDLSSNPEVLLWRKYSVADNIGHSISKYTSTAGADMGINLSLVDDYLTRDGRPFLGAERDQSQQVYGNELKPDIRDPRLSQTVAVPGKPIRPGGIVPAYPPINQTGFNRSTTGYPLYKFLEYNDPRAVSDDFNSQAPAIAFRYAEVLLNYAEAMAELDGDPALIANALKPLRGRAGMPAVDFTREYNTSPSYPFRDLSPVLQAVRRERRVELAAEGFRVDDIMRWAAADILIAGKRPLGALFVGSDMPANYPSTYQPQLTGSTGDMRRYLDPQKNVVPGGYGFNVNRDYLLPIQQRMLQLTANKWVQNPGW